MASSTARVAPLEPATDERPESLAVIANADHAGALIDGTRRRILERLRTTASATAVAAELGISRQLANYHVRKLERAGLVEEVGYRPRRGLQERLVRATATHYLVAPDAVRSDTAGRDQPADRFSAAFQVTTAARTIREVADLAARAHAAGKRLTTLTLDSEVRFASPRAREDFANELVELVTGLVAKYHAPEAADGRRYRLFAGAHPVWIAPETPGDSPAERSAP